MLSFFRLMYCMQGATLTSSRNAVPAISHFDVLDKMDTFENT